MAFYRNRPDFNARVQLKRKGFLFGLAPLMQRAPIKPIMLLCLGQQVFWRGFCLERAIQQLHKDMTKKLLQKGGLRVGEGFFIYPFLF